MSYLIVWIIMQILSLGIVLGKHGEPRPNYNFWTTFIGCLVDWWLLYKAGLFDILTNELL